MKELKFPLYGLIRNYEGLHEENCVYTEEQIRRYDPCVLDYEFDTQKEWDCTDALPRWANDTAMIFKIYNEDQLRRFLHGECNYSQEDLDRYYPTPEENQKDENGEFGDWRDGYYFENTILNYYDDGYDNPTMQYILENLKF